MKFSVPTSWDDDLIEQLKTFQNVREVYGCTSTSIVGGGRPTSTLPSVNEEKAKEHVDFVHSCGIKFNYLVNAPCFGGKEFDKDFRKGMFEYLEWVNNLNADIITVSNPYLVELVRKEYPHWRIKLGLFGRVNSANTAKYFEDIGVERITLPPNFNRMLAALEKLRRNVDCELETIVNLGC
ncbi:MAG: U32 family peptidase, partial [Candidatus Aenigmatarchaeota archaeon]